MTPQIEGTQTGDTSYQVTVRPEYGNTVTLYVTTGRGYRKAYVQTTPDRLGFISQHRTFEAAVKSANYRAKRYLRAYSKPRGIRARTVTA